MSNDLDELMWEYSKRGVKDWKSDASDGLKKLAKKYLANAIVEEEWEVGQAIYGRPGEHKFIPMPKYGYKGFEWSFFLPTRARGKIRSLILLLLVKPEKIMAFRFESSPRGPTGILMSS